jgi:ELWxxDGT repeat protein
MIRSFLLLLFLSLLGLAAAAGGQTAAPVIDLNTSAAPFPSSSNPGQLTAVRGGRIVFAASTQESGRELWASDGTAAGSRMLFDACPGDCDSDPEPPRGRPAKPSGRPTAPPPAPSR